MRLCVEKVVDRGPPLSPPPDTAAQELVTTREAKRAGFVAAVLEKSHLADEFVTDARTLRVKAETGFTSQRTCFNSTDIQIWAAHCCRRIRQSCSTSGHDPIAGRFCVNISSRFWSLLATNLSKSWSIDSCSHTATPLVAKSAILSGYGHKAKLLRVHRLESTPGWHEIFSGFTRKMASGSQPEPARWFRSDQEPSHGPDRLSVATCSPITYSCHLIKTRGRSDGRIEPLDDRARRHERAARTVDICLLELH